MAFWKNGWCWTKLALIITVLALIFYLIGFASPYWEYNERIDKHQGLWDKCLSIFGCKDNVSTSNPGWLQATQAFAVFGLFAGVVALFTLLTAVFKDHCSGGLILIIAMCANLAAFVFIFIAVLLFGCNVASNLSWAYALAVVGMIHFGVAGSLLFVSLILLHR